MFVRLLVGVFVGGLVLAGCGTACADGAADCDEEGDALICIDGQWSVQESCDADETCTIEAGVAFCSGQGPAVDAG